jgi:hypothetical protein
MSSCTSSHCLLIFFLAPEKRERERNERDFWGLESGASPSLLRHGGTELCEPRAHDCCGAHGPPMLQDPVSPTLAEGYVVSFMAFYERGFSMPSHQFRCSLLQHYRMKLHNMTPSGILHIAAFVTLCEAYMGVDPHFDLWNYFFSVHHP